MTTKEKLAKIVRVLTAPPIIAFITCTVAFLSIDNAFSSPIHYLASVFFLTILPVLAYPVARLIPALKKRGRETERDVAIVFSICGYIGGMTVSVLGGTLFERRLFSIYLVSCVVLFVCNLLHLKVSGHTCGISGPIALASITISPWWLLGYLLLVPVIWSSIVLKRHTLIQLLSGAIVPIVAIALCFIFIA